MLPDSAGKCEVGALASQQLPVRPESIAVPWIGAVQVTNSQPHGAVPHPLCGTVVLDGAPPIIDKKGAGGGA
jgi:hypothetical protein